LRSATLLPEPGHADDDEDVGIGVLLDRLDQIDDAATGALAVAHIDLGPQLDEVALVPAKVFIDPLDLGFQCRDERRPALRVAGLALVRIGLDAPERGLVAQGPQRDGVHQKGDQHHQRHGDVPQPGAHRLCTTRPVGVQRGQGDGIDQRSADDEQGQDQAREYEGDVAYRALALCLRGDRRLGAEDQHQHAGQDHCAPGDPVVDEGGADEYARQRNDGQQQQ
jgi:hypothetical protein